MLLLRDKLGVYLSYFATRIVVENVCFVCVCVCVLKLRRYLFLIMFLLLLLRDPQGVLACCNPVPTLVKQYVNEIHQLIMQAKELALNTNKVLTLGYP